MRFKSQIERIAFDSQQKNAARHAAGFTLTEMIVTMLILTLAATLMATGIPVAVDTYHKTVNSANAQVALSTTITVLRSELGSSTKLEKKDGALYYRCNEGSWARITNSEDDKYYGLTKSFYAETPEGNVGDAIKTKDDKTIAYPLVSNAAVTDPLRVSVDSIEEAGKNIVKVQGLKVEDLSRNTLASVDTFEILVPFAE